MEGTRKDKKPKAVFYRTDEMERAIEFFVKTRMSTEGTIYDLMKLKNDPIIKRAPRLIQLMQDIQVGYNSSCWCAVCIEGFVFLEAYLGLIDTEFDQDLKDLFPKKVNETTLNLWNVQMKKLKANQRSLLAKDFMRLSYLYLWSRAQDKDVCNITGVLYRHRFIHPVQFEDHHSIVKKSDAILVINFLGAVLKTFENLRIHKYNLNK